MQLICAVGVPVFVGALVTNVIDGCGREGVTEGALVGVLVARVSVNGVDAGVALEMIVGDGVFGFAIDVTVGSIVPVIA